LREALPDSKLVIFDGAGHFPHRSDPERFLDELVDFIETTDPARHDPGEWRRRLLVGRRTVTATDELGEPAIAPS
jgi:hypothetical protein